MSSGEDRLLYLHALVPAGIMKDGVFYEQKSISTSVIAEIFRARLSIVLKIPQKSYLISVPKNRVFLPFADRKTGKSVQNRKSSPIPPLTTFETPFKPLEKTL